MMFKWIGLTDYRQRTQIKVDVQNDVPWHGPESLPPFTNGRIEDWMLKSTALSGNLLHNFFARLKRVMQLASVNFCAWRSWSISDVTRLELFVQQMNDGCPFLSQSRIARCVWGASSWLRARSLAALIFTTVRTVLGFPLPDFRVVEPVSFKRLRKSFTVLFF